MPEGLKTADGAPVAVDPVGATDEELQRQFSMSMNAPEPDAPQMAAPPPKDPDAPYGRTKDGKPKKGPGGRPAKARDADRPRVQASSPLEPKDYTLALSELTDGVWFLLTVAPATHAQAAIFKGHQVNLIRAFNLGAQNNAVIRHGVELLTGEVTWVAAMGMALVPFALQTAALWSGRLDPDMVTALQQTTAAQLEAIAEQQAQAFTGGEPQA